MRSESAVPPLGQRERRVWVEGGGWRGKKGIGILCVCVRDLL